MRTMIDDSRVIHPRRKIHALMKLRSLSDAAKDRNAVAEVERRLTPNELTELRGLMLKACGRL
jgi:hypothetical protein